MRFTYFFVFVFLLFFVGISDSSAQRQNRRLVRADEAFELRQYSEALNHYRRAYNRVRRQDRREGIRIIYKSALCYYYMNDSRRAEAWFRRAVRMNYPNPEAILYLASALMQNEKYEEAREQFEKFIEKAPDDWRGHRGLESVEVALKLLEEPTSYEVELVRMFNSREDDLSPAFGDHRASSLVFASSRTDALGRNNDLWKGNRHTSFFITYQDRAGNWSRPALLDEGPVNTEYNEGAPALNATATRMYFTRCMRSADVDMGCRIFVADREGADWGQPREIPLATDSMVTVGHPAISPDELELYFVSDMPGSIGRMDIWVSRRRSPNDSFGTPENLGATINTPGSEMFPYVREDGTLFFSSDGHLGLGGLDIFSSQLGPDGLWSEPENLGVPLNSSADDFGIAFYPGREQGFFSSNRPGSRGYDIYSFFLAPFEFTLSGQVLDAETKGVIPAAIIQLIGADGTLVQVETDREGRYMFGTDVIRSNVRYNLIVNKEGYFSTRGEHTISEPRRSEDVVKDFELELIPDRAIPLPEILYEFASWELLPQFQDSLMGLVQTMKDNPTIIIELGSHTDSRGTDQVNDTLSQRRAQVVVDFLIQEGIDARRLVARGYGKRVPRTIENDMVREGFQFRAGTILNEEYINGLPTEEHRDAAHQLNRRTEFRVLSDDFAPDD